MPSNRSIIGLLILLAIVFFFLSLPRPYTEDDVLIYSLIGRAIYQKGLMPFSFVFDHKPVVTYYIYGLLALVAPDNIPKYQIFSVVIYAATAFLTRAFSKKESWMIHFLIITGFAIRSIRFSGNTEILFAPLGLISILLALRSRTMFGMAFAGAFAAVAFNINYIAVFFIGPAILYTLFSSPERRGRQLADLAVYTLGFIVAFGLVLAPLLLNGPGTVAHYFGAQQKFLDSYSEVSENFLTVFLISAVPLFVLLYFCLRCEQKDRRLRNILVTTFVFAFLGALAPGKYFAHYLYPLALPLVILYSMSTDTRKRPVLVLAVLALAAFSLPSLVKGLGTWKQAQAQYDFSQFRQLKAMAGDDPVLSIRAHTAITYFSGVYPGQPLVWNDHARVIYGPKEDDYFLGYLDKRPKFVMTVARLCTVARADWILPKSCAVINADYSQVMTIDDPVGWRAAFVYRLNGS